MRRARDAANARQVVVSLTPRGRGVQSRSVGLTTALQAASGAAPEKLARLNRCLQQLRDAIGDNGDG
ncbi:hypothetical protein [Falsiroseomonas sp.]|uniref:hypothetical protein n=1 Tax=Falsiroseomonas sp. TaxID=2870721 RepID=UPI003F6E4857